MKRSIALALGICCAAACGTNNPFGPYQPQINPAPDNFQFQVTGLNGLTTTAQYSWQNSGTAATVNHSSAVASGTATVTIRDAIGTQVYSGALVASGTPATNSGVAGRWTIRVELVNTVGDLNFRVQKL